MGRTKKRSNGRSKKKVKKNYDINGIVFIGIGIVLAASIYTDYVGYFSNICKIIFSFILGIGMYILPLYIIYLGVLYILTEGKITKSKSFYGITLFIINTLLLIQTITMSDFLSDVGILTSISKLISASSKVHSGIFIFIVNYPIYIMLGAVGCYIIYGSIYLISLIIIFQISLQDLFNGIGNKYKDTKNTNKKTKVKDIKTQGDKGKERQTILPDIKEVKKSDDYINVERNKKEEEEFLNGINNKIKILDFMKNSSMNSVMEDEDVQVVYEDKKEKSNKKDKQEVSTEIDSSLRKEKKQSIYEFPSIELLKNNNSNIMNKGDKKELIDNAATLEETLNNFGVKANVVQVTKGPSVTRFELQPSPGVKVSKIVNLADDIALGLAANGVRIEAPIPGKSAVGIEVPNKVLSSVLLREVLENDEFINSKSKLAFALGKDIGGKCVVADLSKMPHLLIAGATGSGKSVSINTLIMSILYKYSPYEVKLLMIDPKVVELNIYNSVPHLLIPVVTEPKKAAAALNWAVNEMNRRYKLFADNGARNIESYNNLYEKGSIEEKLPWIVIIVDELADLMMACPGDVEEYIARLAQMARAAGMHLVIATQRPSVDVITGVIKANIPSRISFSVSSQIDSRTILDASGAEKLLGKGDMLFHPVGAPKPIRIQGAFISEEEVEVVIEFIKSSAKEAEYQEEIMEEIENKAEDMERDVEEGEKDELLNEAIRIVVDTGQASASFLQRRLKIGFNRAARLIEQLEEARVISPKDGNKPRTVLISKDDIQNY